MGDAGLHLGALFRGLGTAAVELEVHAVAHHRLIAAAAESHFQRQIGIFVKFGDAVQVLADADGQGGMVAVAHLDVADGVQHGEFIFHKVLV